MGRRECRSSKAAWWEQRPSFGQAHRAHQVWRVLMRSLRRSCFRGPTRTPTWSVRPFRPVHEDQGVSKALDETLQANCGTSKGSGSLPCCLRLPTARSPLCAPVACVNQTPAAFFHPHSCIGENYIHSLPVQFPEYASPGLVMLAMLAPLQSRLCVVFYLQQNGQGNLLRALQALQSVSSKNIKPARACGSMQACDMSEERWDLGLSLEMGD